MELVDTRGVDKTEPAPAAHPPQEGVKNPVSIRGCAKKSNKLTTHLQITGTYRATMLEQYHNQIILTTRVIILSTVFAVSIRACQT